MKKVLLLLMLTTSMLVLAQPKTLYNSDSLRLISFEKLLQTYYGNCLDQYRKVDSALTVIELAQKRFEALPKAKTPKEDSARIKEVLRSVVTGLTSMPSPYDVDRSELKTYIANINVLIDGGRTGPEVDACVRMLKNIDDLQTSSRKKIQDRVAVISLFLKSLKKTK